MDRHTTTGDVGRISLVHQTGDKAIHLKETRDARIPTAGRAALRCVIVLFAAVAVGLAGGRAVGWLSFSWLEIVGAVTGGACVLLVVGRSIWNFPLGIVSSAAYLVFFAQDRLYADAGLQIVFIMLGVHGWIAWVLVRTESTTPVRRVSFRELTVLAAAFPVVWLGLVRLLEAVSGAAPAFDGFVTALSLAAQWLLNRRHIENWLAWIVVDQVAVALFLSRGMYLTAGLYVVFLAMCVCGLIEWRRELGGEP